MKILVIIVSYNFERWIDRCLGSLRRSEMQADILVIDNGSSDSTVDIIRERYPEVRLIVSNENLGFGKANNIGMKIALEEGYDCVFLLNQDAWVAPDTITTLANATTAHPDFGIISPVHLTGRGDELDSGFANYAGISKLNQVSADSELTEVAFINAAFWMIPTDVLRTMGGFSPLFYHYGEDVDFVNRLHYHGWKVGYAPVFGNHDREMRNVTKPMEHRAKCVYLLSAYSNINDSFGRAFIKAIGGACQLVVKALANGDLNDAAVYFKHTCRLLRDTPVIRKTRRQTKSRGAHFIIH